MTKTIAPLLPFCYIEYGITRLATAVWRNFKEDKTKGLARYKQAPCSRESTDDSRNLQGSRH